MSSTDHKHTKPIPLHKVAIVRTFVEVLTDTGAPVERGFREAGLPYSALEDANNYVSSHRFWKFLVNMTRSEGVMDLGFRVGEQFGANGADPDMTALLLRAPTLYQGLRNASETVNRTVTNCRVGLLQPPDSGAACFYHSPSCRADNPAIDQIGWFGLKTLLGMVRVYTGPQWQPTEIGFMSDHPPCRYIREQFPHTRMRPSQKCSYILLDNALLSLPPLPAGNSLSVSAAPDYEQLQKDFVGSLEQLLLSYVQESNLSIELAAGLCNTSKRSLQRRLKKMGTCFSEVLEHAQFRAASRMLHHTRMTITDVSSQLGYSDVSHFARAFRRTAGVTPRMYRQQHVQ